MIVIIDNYDSFTYNIVQTIGGFGEDLRVFRNDEVEIAVIEELKPDRLLISPGPCTPAKAGISIASIQHFAGKIPILGVCLGHQSIGEAFGGTMAVLHIQGGADQHHTIGEMPFKESLRLGTRAGIDIRQAKTGNIMGACIEIDHEITCWKVEAGAVGQGRSKAEL